MNGKQKGVEILSLSLGHFDTRQNLQILDVMVGELEEFNTEEMDKYVFDESVKLNILRKQE